MIAGKVVLCDGKGAAEDEHGEEGQPSSEILPLRFHGATEWAGRGDGRFRGNGGFVEDLPAPFQILLRDLDANPADCVGNQPVHLDHVFIQDERHHTTRGKAQPK